MVVESKFNSHEHDRPEGDTSTDTETKDSNGQLIVTVTGAFLIIIGIFLIGRYRECKLLLLGFVIGNKVRNVVSKLKITL